MARPCPTCHVRATPSSSDLLMVGVSRRPLGTCVCRVSGLRVQKHVIPGLAVCSQQSGEPAGKLAEASMGLACPSAKKLNHWISSD